MSITIKNSNTLNNEDGTVKVTIQYSDGTKKIFTEGCSTDFVSSVLEVLLAVPSASILKCGFDASLASLSSVLRTVGSDITISLTDKYSLMENWIENSIEGLSSKFTYSFDVLLNYLKDTLTTTTNSIKSDITNSSSLTEEEKLLTQKGIDGEYESLTNDLNMTKNQIEKEGTNDLGNIFKRISGFGLLGFAISDSNKSNAADFGWHDPILLDLNGDGIQTTTTGNGTYFDADKAALDAVSITAPFRALPADFKGNSVDIQFTFDYNVFGSSGY